MWGGSDAARASGMLLSRRPGSPRLSALLCFILDCRVPAQRHGVPWAADAGGVLGRVPQSLVDDEESLLLTDHDGSLELRSLRRVADNAHKQYLRSRPGPSPESIRRAKDLDVAQLGIHPLFSECRGGTPREGTPPSPSPCTRALSAPRARRPQELASKMPSWRG